MLAPSLAEAGRGSSTISWRCRTATVAHVVPGADHSRIGREQIGRHRDMLPSASLGAPDATGKRRALCEPVHGSAPDIAGKGVANPIAMRGVAMALRYSFNMIELADRLEANRQYSG